MAIISKIICTKCETPIYIEEESIGRKVHCPRCGQEYSVASNEDCVPTPADPQRDSLKNASIPQASPVPFQESPNLINQTPLAETPQFKECPYCSERILFQARKCKHCGEFLDSALRQSYQAERLAAAPMVIKSIRSRGVYIILAIFFGGLMGLHNFYVERYAQAGWQLAIFMLSAIWFVFWEYQWQSLGIFRLIAGPNPAWVAGYGILFNTIWALLDVFSVTTDGKDEPLQ